MNLFKYFDLQTASLGVIISTTDGIIFDSFNLKSTHADKHSDFKYFHKTGVSGLWQNVCNFW